MKAKGQTTWREKFNFNTGTAIFFLLLWIVLFILVPYQIAKPKLVMGRSLMGLEPTLFPRLTTFAAIVLSVWYLAISFEIKEKNLFKEVKKNLYFKVCASFILFVAYALLFERLGFVLASFLVAGTLSTYYGNRNILIGLVVSIGVPFGIYYVFTNLLAVSLPECPFF
jgi:putative tricarboxylic transport membrane protein